MGTETNRFCDGRSASDIQCIPSWAFAFVLPIVLLHQMYCKDENTCRESGPSRFENVPQLVMRALRGDVGDETAGALPFSPSQEALRRWLEAKFGGLGWIGDRRSETSPDNRDLWFWTQNAPRNRIAECPSMRRGLFPLTIWSRRGGTRQTSGWRIGEGDKV
jgi:hypothetical protein